MSEQALNDSQKVQRIRAAVKDEEKRLRQRYPILDRQNAIGFGIFCFAIVGIIGSGYLYVTEVIPAWLCVISSALFTSLLHELEHDLIHFMYFKKTPFMQNLMMAGVWLFRGNIINPWVRRKIHLHHHKVSGTVDDTEERLLGNGLKYGFARMIIMFDAAASGSIFRHLFRDLKTFKSDYVQYVGGFPLGFLFYGTWYAFLAYHAVTLIGPELGYTISLPAWISEQAMPIVNVIAVANIIPNILRQAILNFITTNMHYYGDVDGLMKQTQVLNPWYFMPLQAFCWNFGSTHSIHHFVVSQPFYLRSLCKNRAHEVMRECGVRFNDLGTFKRANRYAKAA